MGVASLYIALTANSPRLLEDASTKGNVEYASTLLIPTCNDDTRTQLILVFVAQLLEQRGHGRDGRCVAIHRRVDLAVLVHCVCNGLRVGRRT